MIVRRKWPKALQRTAAPLGSRTVRVICQRLLRPTGRFRRRSLSLVVERREMHTRLPVYGFLTALGCVLFLGLGVGCRPSRTMSQDEVVEANVASLIPAQVDRQVNLKLPNHILDNIPSRLQSLKPGMSPKQVYQTLDLPSGVSWFDGSGPPERYRLGYQFRTNAFMTLTFNMLSQPASFLDIELHGSGWPAAAK